MFVLISAQERGGAGQPEPPDHRSRPRGCAGFFCVSGTPSKCWIVNVNDKPTE
jgi:hypothetical protein